MSCAHEHRQKFGKTSSGEQRFRCNDCRKTFTEGTSTLAGMRIGTDKAAQVVSGMMEGLSIRSLSRLSGLSKNTIQDLLLLVGGRCKRFMEDTVVGVPVQDVQADELWSFIYCKEKTRRKLSLPLLSYGDQYCFVGMERHHKMVLAWHLGNRDAGVGAKFVRKLAHACWSQRFQITTDGWLAYKPLIRHLLPQASYGMLIKVYGPSQDTVRYSPAQIIEVKYKPISGTPTEERMCTSHVERSNLSIRMGLRRFTRLTNGFSRKFANHEAALGLYFAHYNFCKRHGTLKTAPAVAACLTDERWSVADLIDRTTGYGPPTAFEAFLNTLPDE